jgi:hypothetical protein
MQRAGTFQHRNLQEAVHDEAQECDPAKCEYCLALEDVSPGKRVGGRSTGTPEQVPGDERHYQAINAHRDHTKTKGIVRNSWHTVDVRRAAGSYFDGVESGRFQDRDFQNGAGYERKSRATDDERQLVVWSQVIP